MRFKALLPLLASVSLVSSPVLAATQPPRVATSQVQTEQLNGRVGGGAIIISLLALSAVILGIIAAAKGKDRPNSP